MKYTLLFSLTLFIACKSAEINKKEIARLNNEFVQLYRNIDNKDSAAKALYLLNSITKLDKSNFLAFNNKLMFYQSNSDYTKASSTLDTLLELRPNTFDLHQIAGLLKERQGDTINSKKHFEKSLSIINQVLDTIQTKNDLNIIWLKESKAINLIMLNDSITGNVILKEVYEVHPDSSLKSNIQKMMNKSKADLLKKYFP